MNKTKNGVTEILVREAPESVEGDTCGGGRVEDFSADLSKFWPME